MKTGRYVFHEWNNDKPVETDNIQTLTRGAVTLRYFPLLGRKNKESHIQQIPFTKKPIIDKRILTETLLEEFKPVALKKFEFEKRVI